MDPSTLESTADDLERRASDNRDESDRLLREADRLDSEASDNRAEAGRLRDEQHRAAAQQWSVEGDVSPRRGIF
jgi:hypothetical protein